MSLVLAALGPLVASWSLGGTAWAAEESEVVDTVVSRLEAVGTDALVVCATGEDGEKAARRMLADAAPDVAITRIPVLGDVAAEAERVRKESEATCGVWISKDPSGAWTVGVVGPCTPPDPEPSVGPVVVAESNPSLDADPDETAPAQAPAVVAPTPPPVIVELPPKLTVAERARDPDDIDRVSWHLVDERGVSWSTHRFAQTMGDTDLVARLDSDLERAAKERKVLMWTGIAGMAVSPLPLLYTESGSYGRNADLAWTSLFLLASGGMTFALHKVGEQSDKRRQLRPALYYDRADADALVSAYNSRIDAQKEQLEAEQAKLDAARAAAAAAAAAEADAQESGTTGSEAPADPEPSASPDEQQDGANTEGPAPEEGSPVPPAPAPASPEEPPPPEAPPEGDISAEPAPTNEVPPAAPEGGQPEAPPTDPPASPADAQGAGTAAPAPAPEPPPAEATSPEPEEAGE